MTLIWENCKSYNKEGSELWEVADRLQHKFEQLFCDWVLNVKDRTITDLARGPWDSWMYLRYFDATKADINMCRIRSEEHTSELQSLMRISYAVFCLKQKNHNTNNTLDAK